MAVLYLLRLLLRAALVPAAALALALTGGGAREGVPAAPLSDGFAAVRVDTHSSIFVDQEPGIHYYTLLSPGKYGRAAHCEAFEPDEAEVFSVDLPEFRYFPDEARGDRVIILDAAGETADDPVLFEIAELFRNHPHHICDMAVYRVDGEYLVSFWENVNLHTPYHIYYYNTAQKKIHLLHIFEDETIEAVRIVSPEKLREIE